MLKALQLLSTNMHESEGGITCLQKERRHRLEQGCQRPPARVISTMEGKTGEEKATFPYDWLEASSSERAHTRDHSYSTTDPAQHPQINNVHPQSVHDCNMVTGIVLFR